MDAARKRPTRYRAVVLTALPKLTVRTHTSQVVCQRLTPNMPCKLRRRAVARNHSEQFRPAVWSDKTIGRAKKIVRELFIGDAITRLRVYRNAMFEHHFTTEPSGNSNQDGPQH